MFALNYKFEVKNKGLFTEKQGFIANIAFYNLYWFDNQWVMSLKMDLATLR